MKRLLSLHIKGIPASLRVTQMMGREALGEAYALSLEISLPRALDAPNTLLTRAATLHIQHGRQRAVRHGYLWSIRRLDVHQHEEGYRYALVISPALRFLSQQQDYRVFSQQSIPTIVETLLRTQGIPIASWQCHQTHPAREQCSQHGEDTLAFMQRLCQEAGIHWWFEHTQQAAVLHVSDNNPLQHAAKIHTLAYDTTATLGLTDWQDHRNQQHATFSSDYVPNVQPQQMRTFTHTPNASQPAANGRPLTHYQVGVATDTQAANHFIDEDLDAMQAYADYQNRCRAERANTCAQHITCRSELTNLYPGQCIRLLPHPRGLQGDYLILAVEHQAQDTSITQRARTQSTNIHYHNTLTLTPVTLQQHPRIRTQHTAHTRGSSTATITALHGEAHEVEERGRVHLQPHWDKASEPPTQWTPVKQSWAGQYHGAQTIPRAHQSVLISHQTGHPDIAYAMGALPHQHHPLPFATHPLRLGITTQTPQGHQHNTLRFDDSPHNAGLHLRAARDMTVHTQQNLNHSVTQAHHTTLTQGRYQHTSAQNTQLHAHHAIHLRCGTSELMLNDDGIALQADTLSVEQAEPCVPTNLAPTPPEAIVQTLPPSKPARKPLRAGE